jgi:hypothetical protein
MFSCTWGGSALKKRLQDDEGRRATHETGSTTPWGVVLEKQGGFVSSIAYFAG